MKKVSILTIMIAGGAALTMAFQNCSGQSFSQSDSSPSEKGVLVTMEVGPEDEAGGELLQPADPAAAPAPSPTPPSSPSGGNGHGNGKNPPVAGDSGGNTDGDSTGPLYACILVDHGKSLKLGIVEEGPGGVHGVPKSVCVTRSGCLDMVAKKFSVEGAYKRGYCKANGNPHVVRLSDGDLNALLEKKK